MGDTFSRAEVEEMQVEVDRYSISAAELADEVQEAFGDVAIEKDGAVYLSESMVASYIVLLNEALDMSADQQDLSPIGAAVNILMASVASLTGKPLSNMEEVIKRNGGQIVD